MGANFISGVRRATRAGRGAAAAEDVYGVYLCCFRVACLASVDANPTTVAAASC